MLAYEIYLFWFITISIFILIFYNLIAYIFFPFVWIFNQLKIQYHKIFSLNRLKKQVLENKKEIKDIKNIEKNENTSKIKNKLKKITLEIEFAKQKWDIDTLEQKLVEILSYDENNIKFMEMLSNLYINLWKEKKAFSLLKKLIQLDMQNDNAIWNLSKLYLELWEIDTANILIQKTIDINPSNYRYYITYADILYNKWELEQAIQAIQKVLEIKPNNSIYLDALASLYEEIWESQKSRACWLNILDIDPNYEKAKEKLQNI